jgi:hypothetical protein
MNAHVFGLSVVGTAIADDYDADRWARIRAVASAIADADLEHETDVVLCLYEARMTAREFFDVLDDAVELAREARGR